VPLDAVTFVVVDTHAPGHTPLALSSTAPVNQQLGDWTNIAVTSSRASPSRAPTADYSTTVTLRLHACLTAASKAESRLQSMALSGNVTAVALQSFRASTGATSPIITVGSLAVGSSVPPGSSESTNGGAIGAAVSGCIVLLVCGAICVFVAVRRRKHWRARERLKLTEQQATSDSVIGVNPHPS